MCAYVQLLVLIINNKNARYGHKDKKTKITANYVEMFATKRTSY